MDVRITVRHAKVATETQQAFTEKLQKLEKFFDNIPSCHVVIDSEGSAKVVEISMQIHDHPVNAKARDTVLGRAFSEAVSRVERQLKKINQKFKNHKVPGAPPNEPASPPAEDA